MSFGRRVMAAVDAFRNYGRSQEATQRRLRYRRLMAWYDGSWYYDVRDKSVPALYRNTEQVWSDSYQIVQFYAKYVYPHTISHDGQPLQDGTRGAIPIDANTGGDRTDQQLIDALSQVFVLSNWAQYIPWRVTLCAIYGNLLTEFIDDVDHGVVLNNPVRPDHVVDLDIDLANNVKRYTIEYMVEQGERRAYGQHVPSETYRFRKEVDNTGFWLYKDDKPHAYPELGFPEAEMENPYGFCPAIWDRHQLTDPDSIYGLSAIEQNMRQAMILNGILSHALDYQQKQFAAPVGVIGRTRRTRGITLSGGIAVGSNPTADEIMEARRESAENVNLIDLNEGGQFVSVQFDIGQTKEMLQMLIDARHAERPEARFGYDMIQMSQLTGPAMARALGPSLGEIGLVQKNYDPNTVKAGQIPLAIMGQRLKDNDYPAEIVNARPDRYDPIRPYDLSSFGYGLTDWSVGDRDPFPETDEERVTKLILLGQVIDSGDPWLMQEAGIPEEEVQRIMADQERARQEQLAAFSVAGAGGPDSPSAVATERTNNGQ